MQEISLDGKIGLSKGTFAGKNKWVWEDLPVSPSHMRMCACALKCH